MFIDKKNLLTEDSDLSELWLSTVVPEGNMQYRQILRKYKTGIWTLDISSNFIKIRVTLQEHQARRIIAGSSGESGSLASLDCVVVNEETW